MERERISITLKKQLLKKIDSMVDGMKIRNRSHAIEFLLSKSLTPFVSKAVILAGGPGTKMRPFTYEIPKALIPVQGRALLEYTIELLKKNNITDIVISIGHLGDKIREHFGNGGRYGVNIQYVQQAQVTGTGGALAGVSGFFTKEPFVLMHGDVLVDIELQDLISFHQDQDYSVSMALTSVSNPSDFGVVSLRGNAVVAFSEKPKKDKSSSHLINAGVYVCDPEIFDYLPATGECSLEKDIFPQLIQEHKLGGYMFDGMWYDVGTPEIYEQVLKEWRT
jgi:NDP-sugar pyrophosphorylase family protein